jgi:hypothetical protein
MTAEQMEILMLDSAIESQRLCVARMKRRREQAQIELEQAWTDLEAMDHKSWI